jgi:6-phosphogluconolactonase
MHHLLRLTRAILLGLIGLTAVAVPATASADARSVAGHVYVEDNTTGTNTIAAFDRQPDGTLSPLAGSPFDAGGAGTGSGLPSQGAVQITDSGRYLLAVDAASNQISVFRIRHDGTLRLVDLVSSGGLKPVSIAVHHTLVYVANSANGGANYTGFRLSRQGQLRPLAGSTVTLPDGAQPGDVLFNSTGSNLIGTRVGTSEVDSFSVGSDGLLTPAPGSPFSAQGLGPFGSEFRPTNPSQLFVSNAHNTAPDSGTVSAFAVSSHGTLTPIRKSPFADEQMAPCWVEISHDGKFLFTVNTASGSISRYRIREDGSLKLIGSTLISTGGAGIGAVDLRLSPDGATLFVVDSKIPAVSSFAVDGGNLTELGSPTPLPTGATPAGIAVN